MLSFLRHQHADRSARHKQRRGRRSLREIGLTIERAEPRLAMTGGFGDVMIPPVMTPPAVEPPAAAWAPPATSGQPSDGVPSGPATPVPAVEDLIKEFKANVERWDVPRDPHPGPVSCTGEWPPRFPHTLSPPEGDLYLGAQGELTALFGVSFGIGAVIDLDHPYESGIYFSPGMTCGINCGASVGVGYTPADVEGPSVNVDVSVGPISVTGSGMIGNLDYPYTTTQGGGQIGVGVGFGASAGLGETYTLSPQGVFGDNIYSPDWWLGWFN